MSYFRDATPEEIERGEATTWKIRTPEADESSAEEQSGHSNKANLQYDHKVLVYEPVDSWYTATDLIDWGYKPDALTGLFGPRIEGPDGIQGWLVAHVDHIERTVINSAVELLRSSFQPFRLGDTFPNTPDSDRTPSATEVAAMVEALPPAVTATATK